MSETEDEAEETEILGETEGKKKTPNSSGVGITTTRSHETLWNSTHLPSEW